MIIWLNLFILCTGAETEAIFCMAFVKSLHRKFRIVHNKTEKGGVGMKKRLLAMALAVAMIIGMLPVIAFADGHANVADEVNQNILTDSFGDNRYTNGTFYQWNTKDRYAPVTRTLGNDGLYSVALGDTAQTENNYAVTYLTARDLVDGTDYSAGWTDYSVEMTGRLNTGATTNQNKMFLMGRVQKLADGTINYYAAALRYSMNVVYLYKGTINGTDNPGFPPRCREDASLPFRTRPSPRQS